MTLLFCVDMLGLHVRSQFGAELSVDSAAQLVVVSVWYWIYAPLCEDIKRSSD